MTLKFLAADGSGTTSSAIKAIYYAVNNGAQIINNSWGGPSYSSSLHDAMAFAYGHGVLTVNAAGNSGKNSDIEPMYQVKSIQNLIRNEKILCLNYRISIEQSLCARHLFYGQIQNAEFLYANKMEVKCRTLAPTSKFLLIIWSEQ
jgi:subtilisin family serine protease